MKARYLLILGLFGLLSGVNGQTTTVFNTSGNHNWTCPGGVTSIQVEAWGGGAGGRTSSNTNNHCGGGGGGGAYARRNSITVIPGVDYTFTVGGGGAANAAGAQSTAIINGVTITAVGGATGPGSGTPGLGGAGGAASSCIGDVVFSGGNGADGSNSGSNNGTGGGGGGGAGSTGAGQNGNLATGGAATLNNGGAGGAGGVNAIGQAASATGFGGGGGGGGHKSRAGGAGRVGAFVLTYTCPTITPTAGPNQTLATCAQTATLAGSAVPAGATGTWSVFNGSAVFDNPNSPTTSVSNLALGETNVLRWTINNGACGSFFADVSITTSIGPGCNSYCLPEATQCTPNVTGGCGVQNFVISNVTIGTLNNTSSTNSCNAHNGVNGYSDFTGVSAPTLLIGNTYNLSITVGTFTCGPTHAMVWFDFNGNGNWTDPGEAFLIGAMTSGGTTTIPITIPTGALEITTRMRVRYIYATTILSSYSCTSGAQGGETEDYTVTIQCSTTPSDVTGRFPANALALTCGSAANLIWDFHRCATGYKVYLGTTNPANTLITTINDPTVTQYYTGNLLDNTTYYWRIVPFNGSGDGASSNWSFTTQTGIQTAISQDEEGCGEGGLTLTASGALPEYYWYNVPSGGTPIATGPTYSPVGLTEPTSFYVSNVLLGPAASITCGTTSTVVCSSTARGWGTTFDVQAKSANLNITGADIMFRNLGTGGSSTRPVSVYYRTESYIGKANNAAGWILVGNYNITVPNTTTAPIFVDFADVFVPAAARYGFYIVYDQEYAPGANVYSNVDIEVLTGASICGSAFGTVINDRSFRGTVYYTTNCASPPVEVVATPYVSPNEVTLALATVTGAVEQCTEAGWTYYADPTAPTEWLFAIAKNGNTFTATVDIYEQALPFEWVNSGASPHGSELMSRYWNVNMTSGSIATSVGVRFFFDPQEITDAFNLRNATKALYPGTFDVPWRWFKTVSGNFNHLTAPIDGNIFNFTNITPTASMPLNINGAGYTGTINGVAYVEFSGLTSFSGGGGGFGFSTWDNVALPIELVSFTGQDFEGYNQLFWSTASELNNEYFIIESSATGENFEEVERVQGAGNSTQTLHYSLKDYNYSPTTYYLLKQVDFDGTVTSHQVIVVNRKELYGNLSLNVFPNPTNGELTIRANTLNAGEYEIRVVNTLGMTVHVERTYLIEGVNDRTIDFSHLAKGIYSIEINSGQDRKVVRFVKQ
jgi:hypothetical protein